MKTEALRWSRRRPRRRAIPTRAGILMLTAPAILGLAGVTAGNNLLFLLLGASLGSILLSGFISEASISPVRVRLRPVGPLRAGQAGRFTVQFERTQSGRGRRPLFGLTVQERNGSLWAMLRRRIEPGRLHATLPVLVGSSDQRMASRYVDKRGPVTLGLVELSTTHPFGLLHKIRDVDLDLELYARPRRVELPAVLQRSGAAWSGEAHRPEVGEGVEFSGVRERRDQEPVRRLHALRSATLGRDVVLETADESRPTTKVGLWAPPGCDPDAFERCLEVLAAFLDDRDRGGVQVFFWAEGRWTVGSEAAQERLARMEPGSASAPLSDPDIFWFVPRGCRAPSPGSGISVSETGECRLFEGGDR